MSDNRRTDGGVIVAVVLIAVGAWLLLGRVLGDWWSPVRQVFAFAGRLAFPLALIAIGVLVLFAAQGKLSGLNMHGKRLYRSRSERMIAGVLGGLADILGVDPTVLRIAYVIFGLASGGAALLLYIIAAVVIPEEPVNKPQQPSWPGDTGRETVQTPPPVPAAPQPPAAPVSDAPAPPPAPEPPSAPEPPA